MEEFKLEGERELLNKEKAQELANKLESNISSLKRIQLSGKSFGNEASNVFQKVLEKLPNSLSSCDFSDIISGRPEAEALEALRTLTKPFKERKELLEINLSDNALGLKGINACIDLLAGQEKLENLFLNNDGLAADAGDKLKEILLFRGPTLLKKFQIVNNLLGDGGVISLSEVLASSPLLEEVRFGGNRFTKVGGEAIMNGLSKGSHKLVHVELCDNNFTGLKSRSLLKEILRNQPNLTFLNVADAGLESEGVIAILGALLDSKAPLQHLDISGNDLDEDASEHVAKLIKATPTLKHLNVASNEIGSDGATKIARAISETKNSSLVGLNFAANQITNGAEKKITKLLESFNELNMDFEDNQEEDEDEEDAESGKEDEEIDALAQKIGSKLNI